MKKNNAKRFFSNSATFFFFPHRSFYHTVIYCLLKYARPTICAEDFLLHPIIARLSTETAAFVSFRLLRHQRVCFWMHSDVHFCFSSLSFSTSSASPSFIVARRSLSVAHFCFSRRRLPFSRLVHLLVTVIGFLVVLLFRHRPLIRLLQLVVAIVGLPLVKLQLLIADVDLLS